jgi:hypothetical protein
MMGVREVFSVPVVFADRFFMSDKSLAEISSLGGFAWADAQDPLDLAEKLANSQSVQPVSNTFALHPFWRELPG